MKRIFIVILTVSAFCALNAGVSEEKSLNKDDNFLRTTPNVQNEELRFELANLKKQFNLDKSRIHDLYAEKMDALKSARQNEIKSLKNDFASRRELLFNKYPPITQRNTEGQILQWIGFLYIKKIIIGTIGT